MSLSALIKPAIGLGSALLGGIGGAGKQGAQKMTSTNTTTGSAHDVATTNQLQHIIENPLFSQFREGLLPEYAKELHNAQAPVFGQAQIADYMQNVNKLGKAATDSLTSGLARRGALNSGALVSGLGDIDRGIMSNKTSFLAQLPFQEAQAHADRVNPLLNMGINWAGRVPTDTQLTGTNVDDKTFNQSSVTNGMTEMQGPSMWRGLAGNLADGMLAGGGGYGPFASLSKIGWGKNQGGTPGNVY